MIVIIILLVVALLLHLATWFTFAGLPDSRTSSGKQSRMLMAGVGLFIIAAIGVSIAIKVQETTGVVTGGLSGGLESDARVWISRNRSQPPASNQTGDNIRILREGLTFIGNHPSLAETPEIQTVVQRYRLLPARPTRLLTRDEETQYYEGAKAVYQLIGNVAGETASAESE